MAPRGPKGQPSAGRETRSTALNSKASSRGGISKKRGITRTDTDGDLDMDSSGRKAKRTIAGDSSISTSKPSSRSATTARGASRTAQTMIKHLKNGDPSTLASRISKSEKENKTNGRTRADGLTYLRVHGVKQSKAASNADGGLQAVLLFLERKASTFTGTGRSKRKVMIKKSHMAGDYVFVAASKEDADEIIKCNTFVFAGVPLEIIDSTDGLEGYSKVTESKETKELREKLRTILGLRYVGANKLLKLDSLAEDPELLTLGAFETKDRAIKTLKGLMTVCDSNFKTAREKSDAIVSISLANNNIDDVAQVETVASTFPHLKNLDISNNQIGNLKGLERWKGRFRDLETLFISGNPIESNVSNFQLTILEWFPKLQNINGAVLRGPEQIAQAQQAASKYNPIPQNGPDFRDVNGIGETFLVEFFASYDNERQNLTSRLYDEHSQFSLAVDAQSVRNTDVPTAPWSAYIKASRNLLKITTHNARSQRLYKGSNAIAELWSTLPATRHPNIKTDISKYIMDCHPIGGLVDPTNQNQAGVDGLIISVHGEFDEHDAKTDGLAKRSFSRTFVLGPGLPGKAAIRVVSDMLSLRAYNPLPNVHNAPAAPPTTIPVATLNGVSASNNGQDQHQTMIAELCKQTGMTPQYSEMCLTQVEWVFDKALVIFNEKKTQLPTEAFTRATH